VSSNNVSLSVSCGSAVLLSGDTVQFRKRTLHLQEVFSSARAKPKLVKMLREEIMCVAFYSDSRLAFPRSDNTSLGFIALMFTYIAQYRGCPGSAALLSGDTVQFRKRKLHLQEVFSSARAKPKLVKMLREEIMCVAFLLRQSACFSSL
jgi:septum formation topological specificity factor MinE